MRKTILALAMLFVGAASYGAEKEAANDTIPFSSTQITKVVTDETTTAKGRKVMKYYFMVNEQLIPTSKAVVAHYNLSKKHGAKCGLALVKSAKTGKKRIILN